MMRFWALSITFILVIGIFNQIGSEDSRAYKFRGGMENLGVFDSEVSDNYSLLWSFEAGGSSLQSSPVVVNDRVYFGSTGGNLYCVDALTGDEVWNFSTGNAITSTPCIVDNVVYIGSNDRNIYALDAENGSKLWNYTFASLSAQISSSISVVNDLLFVGADDGSFYALNISDVQYLSLEWEFPTGGWVQSSPAVDWPFVYFGSLDGYLYCVWAENGSEKWNFSADIGKLDNDIYGSPLIEGGKIYIGSEDKNLYCLDSRTGSLIWNFTSSFYIYSSAALHDDKVFVHGTDRSGLKIGRIFALPQEDPNDDGIIDDSEVLWSFETGDWDGGSSPAVAGGKVLVGSTQDKLFCLDENTGLELWNLTTGHYIVASPYVDNGIVYITSEDGTLYALGGDVPISLDIAIIPEYSDLKAGRVMGISFLVTYRGYPVEGAFINVEVSGGNLSQYGASTFPDGTQRIKFTAPNFDTNTTIIVTASAVKFGYPDGVADAQFIIEPSASYDQVSSGNTFSLSKYWLYLVMIILLIVINFILVIVHLKKRSSKEVSNDEE